MLAYKQHFTVDSHRRVVTAVEVTPAAAQDAEQVPRLLDQQPLRPQEFCADSHYGVPKVYAELRRRGIWAAIPRCSPQSRRPKPGRLSTAAFQYVPEGDVYLCPQGQELRRVAYEARWDRYHYRPRESDCRSCPLRLACCTLKAVRTVIRYSEQETLEWAEAYLTSPQGRQHLWELARRLYPNDEGKQRGWMKLHQKRPLDRGKIERLVGVLRAIPSRNPEVAEKLRTEADYFERTAERMRYPKFRRQHLFVGSGVIEAGCKTVVASRLKRSGMFWTVRGANAILALRCAYLNGRFEDYWESRRAAMAA